MEQKLEKKAPSFSTQLTQIPLRLEFSGLTYYVKKQKENVCVMHGASGACLPGTLTAIMGLSGAGKSTLLNILSGRIRQQKVQGDVYFNGRLRTKLSRLITAYVMQADMFFPELTVSDTLKYTALLRLGKKMSYEEKMQRVEDAIEMMGLSECRNSNVGNAYRRGISGGELKRLNVANELLTNPSLFMLDEPTSGLDSNAAAQLVNTLYNMAHDTRRTVVCSIHQPSSRVFHRFDRLIGIMGGHIVYQGDVKKCGEYFAALGFECPRGYNLADHIIDLFTDQKRLDFLTQAYRKHVMVDKTGAYDMTIPTSFQRVERPLDTSFAMPPSLLNAAYFQQAVEDKEATTTAATQLADVSNLNRGGENSTPIDVIGSAAIDTVKKKETDGGDIKKNASASLDSSFGFQLVEVQVDGTMSQAASQSPHCAEEENGKPITAASAQDGGNDDYAIMSLDELIKKYHDRPPYTQQTLVLLRRCFACHPKKMWKSMDMVQTVIVGLMVGCLWFNSISYYTQSRLNDRMGLILFNASYWTFLPAFAAMASFPPERAVVAKERAAKSYGVSSYLIAKTLAEIPIHCITPTIWILIIYPMGGFPWTAESFFCIWLTTLLDALVGHSVGMLTSALFDDFRHGSVFLSVVLLATILTSGFFVKLEFIPVWIGWMKWFAFVMYIVSTHLQINLSGKFIECDVTPAGQPPVGYSQCPIPGDEVISSLTTHLPIWLNVLILIVMFVIAKLICYCILRFSNKLRLE